MEQSQASSLKNDNQSWAKILRLVLFTSLILFSLLFSLTAGLEVTRIREIDTAEFISAAIKSTLPSRDGTDSYLYRVSSASPSNMSTSHSKTRKTSNSIPTVSKISTHAKFPQWMQNYFDWHAHVKSNLSPNNFNDYKYLIIRCLWTDGRCGGASDRLQLLPWAIQLANRTNRVLLIKWQRPADLEEFLVPPEGGLDWRVPSWMNRRYFPDKTIRHVFYVTASEVLVKKKLVVMVKQQEHDHGAHYYNMQIAADEPRYWEIFGDVWRYVFTPSPPVAHMIDKYLNELELTPNAYVSIHLRSRYIRDERHVPSHRKNAVRCAQVTRPGLPMYVASDSAYVTRRTAQFGSNSNLTVKYRFDQEEPIHIDAGRDFITRDNDSFRNFTASDFYDTFVDLYLLAYGQCVVYGRGGYGVWAALISGNASCAVSHVKNICSWTQILNRAQLFTGKGNAQEADQHAIFK